MEIVELRAYRGRNIYSHRKAVLMVIDLKSWVNVPSKDIDSFNASLLKILPSLKDHRCSLGYPGGFIQRLKEGTYLAHVIEHIAIEILNILGDEVNFGKTREIKNTSHYTIVYEYGDETRGIESGKVAMQLVHSLCLQKKFDLNSALNIIKEKVNRNRLGVSTQSIVNEAKKRQIPCIRIGNGSIVQLGYGKFQKRIQATIPEDTSSIAVDIACDKTITKTLLKESGIPVPEGYICSNLGDTFNIAEKIGYPLVIKPERGNQGRGVSLDINTPEDLRDAYFIAKQYNPMILVERYIKGNDYRVLVINGRVSAVAMRTPAYIIGDGIRNVLDLVKMVNEDPRRGEDHEKPLTKIKLDDISLKVLEKQGYKTSSIPLKGQKVLLKENGNLSTGGEAVDCTDTIHPENAAIAVRAAGIIGLHIAGIDITCTDISKPIVETGGALIEINAAPGIRMHLFPSRGKPRNVSSHILNMLFPIGKSCSIPIISITGTNGKTTTARMISHIFKVLGKNVGTAVTGGIYINDRCYIEGDTTGPNSAKTVLMHKDIDIAVLETARGGIIRGGLGYDLCDVGVLTNLSEDHIGLDGINTLDDLLFVKSLVVESIKPKGYAILNADDPMVCQVHDKIKSKIIYFSKEEDNFILRKHILSGGKAVFLKDNYVTIATENGNIQSMDIKKIPACYDGKLAHNVENSLAAISASYAMGLPISIIEKAMSSFYSDGLQNPGRFNIFNIRDFRVIIDYGHNIAGYKSMGEAIKTMGASRTIGIIGVPSDRDNESIRKIGNISAKIFNRIIIKEDQDLRNRNRGEVAKLLEEGVLAGGMCNSSIDIILSETMALQKAINEAMSGDLIVIFYENLEPVLKMVKEAPTKLYNDWLKNLKSLSYR